MGESCVSAVPEEAVLSANLLRAPARGTGNAPKESTHPWSRPTKLDQRQGWRSQLPPVSSQAAGGFLSQTLQNHRIQSGA